MKVAIVLLVLGTTYLAPAAIAADAKELVWDNLTFCSQFVIRDPDPRIVRNHIRDCCTYSRNRRDCHLYDWGIDEDPIAR
jgi:hypothetical protein